MYVTIYGTESCTYCKQAEALCKREGLGYEYILLNIDNSIKLQERIGTLRSVPQIFIDDVHIGGFDELKKEIEESKTDE